MKRTLEPVDLMVVIGLCATLLGGALFFIPVKGVRTRESLNPSC